MNYQSLSEEELLNHQAHFIDFAKNDPDYFKFIPAKLRNQKEFIFNFIKYFEDKSEIYPKEYVGTYAKFILASSLIFNDDKEVVLKLTEKSSECVEYVSERLRADKEIALVAVISASKDSASNQHHFAHHTFRHFSDELKKKIFNLSNYDEVIKFLESEILYEKLYQDLPENQIATKRIKI